MLTNEFKILVLIHNSRHTFGFGKNITEAKVSAKKYLQEGFRFSTNNHRIWIVSHDTKVDNIGNIISQGKFKPVDIT